MSTAASPQADAEMIAQLGHRDLWAAYSPLFQRACQCLCCFTLWFPQRSWINIISPPQGITALVSPSLLIAAATGVLLCIKALWRWPYIRDFSCALNGSNWFRSMPWHNNRSSCNFSGLSTLNPLKCFFFLFCFAAEAACSLWGDAVRAVSARVEGGCLTQGNDCWAELSPEAGSGHPLWAGLLGCH